MDGSRPVEAVEAAAFYGDDVFVLWRDGVRRVHEGHENGQDWCVFFWARGLVLTEVGKGIT